MAKSQINGEEIAGANKTLFSTFLSVLSPVMLGLTVLFGIVFILISFFLPSDIESNETNTANAQIQQPDNEVVLIEEATPVAVEESVEVVAIPEIVAQSIVETPIETKEPQIVEEVVLQKSAEVELTPLTNDKIEEKIIEQQAVITPVIEVKPVVSQVIPTITNKTLDLKPKVAANEKAILDIAPNKFTIQLLGAAQENRIIEFIQANNLKDKAYYYRTTHNDKPWFILIYGNYASRAEAAEAVKILPKEVQSLKPWARDVASIHKVLKKES